MTAQSQKQGPRVCRIADALDLVGDRWALLVLRELTLGVPAGCVAPIAAP